MNTINGKSYEGNSIVIINDRIIIDGKDVTDEDTPKDILSIKVEGTLASLQSDKSVKCGNVQGHVNAGGSVNCDNIAGNASAAGSINCDDVGGNVQAGGSVNCDKVMGKVG